MEIIKIKDGKRWLNYSELIIPKPDKQKHIIQLILVELDNKLIEFGFEINVVESNFNRVQFTTTDIYKINQKGSEVNDKKTRQVICDTFQIAKFIYLENKTSLSLVEPMQYSLNDEMPQILQELTHILHTLH